MLRRIADRNIWIIYASILLLGIAYGVTIAVLAIHLDAHHISKIAMGTLASAFAFGIVTFAVPAGWAIARFGAKRTMIVALIGYAASVTTFPFLTTVPTLCATRFFDGAFSVGVWVAAETALLSRADTSNKAFVMSLYAMSIALGYVLGPLLAMGVVPLAGTGGSFLAAGALACAAALVIATQLDGTPARATHDAGEARGEGAAARVVFWRTKVSCLATFSYGYFQASVVLFLPLYLIEDKGVAEQRTILVTAFFAAGMITLTTVVSRIGDKHGHLLVMRALGAIGGLMVASFVLLDSFWIMCGAVFVAGATLASISPVSLALQGLVTPSADLGRANAFYNAAYAAGMLVGPPISSVLFTRFGGGAMLLHLAGLWAGFVTFTVIFAADDPRARRTRPATMLR